jgi:hypothetical protein
MKTTLVIALVALLMFLAFVYGAATVGWALLNKLWDK